MMKRMSQQKAKTENNLFLHTDDEKKQVKAPARRLSPILYLVIKGEVIQGAFSGLAIETIDIVRTI